MHCIEIRLDRARNLLIQKEQLISEVAQGPGFESSGHFSWVCRGAFCIPPTFQSGRSR